MKRASDILCKETMAERFVERIAESFEIPSDAGGLRRFEVNIDRLDLLEWLGVQKDDIRIYFSARDDSFEMAGVGAADVLDEDSSMSLQDTLEAMERNLANCDGAIRYYGGICFDADSDVSPEWESFGRRRFVVPRFEVCRRGDDYSLAFNMMCKSSDNEDSVAAAMLDSLGRLNFDRKKSNVSNPKEVISRIDNPDRSKWVKDVAEVIRNIQSHGISKIVLARKTDFDLAENIDPFDMLRQIKQEESRAYDFCFEFDGSAAFIGSSPECLFRKEGESVYSEAVAGTLLRGVGGSEQLLLESDKELQEHKFVYDNVESAMDEICSTVDVISDREVMTLRHLMHICSRFRGTIKDGVSVYDIIKLLHPTAAVNGFPSEPAKAGIREIEPFSRGWYAGPVGWVSRDMAEFAVGIRSALIDKSKVSLFAGAGIIESSDPELEWDEIENKLRQFLDLLG